MGVSEWRVIVDRGRASHEQMTFDEQLAREVLPTLRLFFWEPPAISLGWKQRLPEWLNLPQWRAAGLDVVERPTGGGMAFHGSDLSFGVVIPRAWDVPLESQMSAICEVLVRLCHAYGVEARVECEARTTSRVTYCLAEPAPYSVRIAGRKVAGFALRRYTESWLIQGSLLLHSLPGALVSAVPQEVIERLRQHAVALAEVTSAPLHQQDVAQRFANSWSVWWDEALMGAVGAACL